MNARFPANFLRNALLVLLGLTVQAGHTQTVVCPAGIIPPNSQCATPIFGPWQYQALHVFDNMDSALNEIMGSILAHPEIYFGYSVCANTIAFSGVVKDWCPGNNACRVWGGQYIDFTQTHEVTASLRNDLTPGCPVSTFVLPTLRQSRTLLTSQ